VVINYLNHLSDKCMLGYSDEWQEQWTAEVRPRVVSGCHPSEGASKTRTQTPIIHNPVLFFSSRPSLG
jgi:hypothetical protein